MHWFIITVLALTAESEQPAGSASQNTTVTGEISAEFVLRPSGTNRWTTKTIEIPKGCVYIAHDLELIDRKPVDPKEKSPVDPRHYFRDWIARDENARVALLGVTVRARRPDGLGWGSAKSTVLIKIVVNCDDLSLDELRRHLE